MSTHSPEDVVSDFRSNGDHSSDNKTGRSRRSKACKSCHALKVRCIPVDENDPASPCVRCLNAKKVCEFDNFEPKKRRKKTAPRSDKDPVAELKSQINALQSEIKYLRSMSPSTPAGSHHLLNGHQSYSPLHSASDSSSPPFMTKTDLEKELSLLSGNDSSLKDISDEIKEFASLRERTLPDSNPIDSISLGIIDSKSAQIRLEMYRTVLYQSHSYVKIPDNLTVEDMMKTQPFLLNTILAVTCIMRKEPSEMQQCLALEKHATASITREILVNGSKTVELVKCLILLSVWYNTPEFFKARRYHILNQMAVTLLYDLGIVTRQSFTYSGETKTIQKADAISDDIEYRVLILTLYCSTVGFCLILRRSIFVKWTTYVEECCLMLEKHSNEHFKNVALFSRLTRELEKVHHIVHSPDSYVTNPKISAYTMTDLGTRLAVIGNSLSKDNHVLLAYYYSIEAYLHQPSSEDLQVRSVGLNCTEELTTRTLNTISQCTSSCLKAMDEFNQLTDEQIAGLPLFHFSRYIYTAGILMRLRYFILSLPSNIEKDLVPRYAIVSVSNLHHRINAISTAYPTNFLMKKMKLVLRLFVQTYVTQVNELLARNDDGSHTTSMTQASRNAYKNMNKLAYSIMNPSQGNEIEKDVSHGVHLDLLSYAATEHSKSNGILSDSKENDKILNEPTPLAVDKTSSNLKGPHAKEFIEGTTPSTIPPLSENRFISGQRTNEANNGMYEDQSVRGATFQAEVPQINHQSFRPATQHKPVVVSDLTTNDPKDHNKDLYEFDDEFWANLLSNNSDKYFFAQDIPNGTENVLYNMFS